MKEKPFYQCEHCIHYIQHYNIVKNEISKVDCGHCICKDKNLKPSLRECKFFKQRVEESQIKENQQYSLQILKEIEKALKYLKLYLNKSEEIQKLDNCLMEDIKKT